MNWLLIGLTVIFVLDALRLRARISALQVLPEHEPLPGTTGDSSFMARKAAELPHDLLQRACAYRRAQQLDLLDLMPGKLGSLRVLALASLVDPRSYRRDRLAAGHTAGHLLVLSNALRERADIPTRWGADSTAFAAAASRAKTYACTSSDFAIARDLPALPEDHAQRLRVLRALFGHFTPFLLGFQLLVHLLLIAGVALPGARPYGLLALLAFQLQPCLAIAGTALRPHDLALVSIARLPLELVSWLRTVASGLWPAPNPAIAERRPIYDQLLSTDLGRFFEARRQSCPICDGPHLRVHLQNGDLLQHKPGTFTLERCDDCAHIFQNPALSAEGLSFYYRDFYDGLGEQGLGFIFGSQSSIYLQRARMVQRWRSPQRWLDVGAGHGHFCCVASEVLPTTRFDGLDLSESIDEAVRRGWVQNGHRGRFPERAKAIAGSYDVVSMHHYLEHTLDPASEIAAASTALGKRGHLLIELPDPESRLAPLLGRYWMPWFQPQHQHLLSTRNLERLLHQYGFTALEWHRGAAHQRVDFIFAVFLFLGRIAPAREVPWRPRPTRLQAVLRVVIWALGTPLIALGGVLDRALEPVLPRIGASNTYRVLAQKNG
jgi:SAM-dependent methyltransferase